MNRPTFSRWLGIGLLHSCCLWNVAIVWAQAPMPMQDAPAAGQGTAAAPQDLPSGMEQILQTWEQHSAGMNRLEGSFQRYEYDSVFRVEKRAEGNYYYEAPDKGRMDFAPPKNMPNQPNTVGNIQFQVQGDIRQTWICTGDAILDVNHDQKTYNRVQIPAQFQGENIVHSPLPFLFGMKADDIKKRYLLAFGSMHDPAQGKVHIVAAPLMPAQQREYRRVEVLLNTQNFLPTAVKLFGTTDSKETVYVFTQHTPRRLPWVPTSPFKSTYSNYTLLDDIKAPPESAQRMIPNGQFQRTAEGPQTTGRTQLR